MRRNNLNKIYRYFKLRTNTIISISMIKYIIDTLLGLTIASCIQIIGILLFAWFLKHVLVCFKWFLTTCSQSRMRVPEISQHQHPGYPIQHPKYPAQHSRYPAQQPPCPIQPYTPPIGVVPELRVPVGVCWRCRKLYQEQTEVETLRSVTQLNVTYIMNHHSRKVAEVEMYIMNRGNCTVP